MCNKGSYPARNVYEDTYSFFVRFSKYSLRALRCELYYDILCREHQERPNLEDKLFEI